MHKYANPRRFLKLARVVHPWCIGAALFCFVAGLYMVFFASPIDYQQGGAVRMMYVHVPAAWMAMFVYSTIAISSLMFLVWRHPVADMIARSSGVLGAGFALITLITGAVWGKPMWGTWWEWDARLTSMLVLFFLYLGYIAVASQAEDDEPAQKIASILALVGFVNIPIIKFSVDWWATLHQPASVFRMDGPTIEAAMLWPLGLMALAFTFFYMSLVIYEIETMVAGAKLRRMRLSIQS